MNAKLLNDRNAFLHLYDLTNGYGKFTQIVNMLNKNSQPRQINTADSKIEKLTIGTLEVIAEILTRTVSGNNLILTFTDANYDFFRNENVVHDSFRNQGFVLSHAPGTITIAPFSTTTAFTSSMFVLGQMAKASWDSSANRGSTGKENLLATPDSDFNYGSIKRDSVFINRRDLHSSYVDGTITQKNWALGQESVMTKRVAYNLEKAYLFEERFKGIVNGKEYSQNGSLLWAIKNRGGTHIVSPNDLDETTWRDLISIVRKKNADGGGGLMFCHGTEALAKVQGFAEKFVLNAGANNTFGGAKVSGINVQTYGYLGVDIDFVHLPILDDPFYNPEVSSITGKQRTSSSFFLLDTSPVMSYDKGVVPCIERFYFDIEGMRYFYIPGTVGANGENPSGTTINGKFMVSNDLDGVSCQCLYDGGIDIINAKRMLFWELAT